MRIRTLLSISHALVVGTFIATFLIVFFYLTRPPSPPPGLQDSTTVRDLIKSGQKGEPLLAKLNTLGHRKSKELDVFDSNGRWMFVAGEDKEVEPPAFLSEIRNGHIFQDLSSPKNHIFWLPLSLDAPNSHVLRWEVERTRDLFFSEVRRNVGIACGIAFLTVIIIVVTLSRALAAPIRTLASMVDRFGREGYAMRSNIGGAAEVVELGKSFNLMAEYIETNTNELREQKEQAQQAEALRRQFLSDVSHNLRTPLAAILGWNDALLEGVVDDEELYRQRIRREVLHVTRTVQRLLELSRWERSSPVLLLERFPLSELLLEVAENLQDSAEQVGVSLSFEGLTPDIHIRADRQKARDVFQILLENVVDHAGMNVHVNVAIEEKGDLVWVTIDDNGVGLPDTFHVDPDIERGASEIGRACLGLAIASRLVSAHGSSLTLSNRAEGGLRATFGFPR